MRASIEEVTKNRAQKTLTIIAKLKAQVKKLKGKDLTIGEHLKIS